MSKPMLRQQACNPHEWWEFPKENLFATKMQKCRLCGATRDVQPEPRELVDKGWTKVE